MKIIKSGVLAAFVVLALMVSHGVHADIKDIAPLLMALDKATKWKDLDEDALEDMVFTMRALSDIERLDRAISMCVSLHHAIRDLSKVLSKGVPEKEVKALIATLKILQKKQLPLEIEQITQALRRSPLISLVEPFQAFANAVQGTKDLNSDDMGAPLHALWILRTAIRAKSPKNSLNHLNHTIFCLRGVKGGHLDAPANLLKTAIERVRKKILRKNPQLSKRGSRKYCPLAGIL